MINKIELKEKISKRYEISDSPDWVEKFSDKELLSFIRETNIYKKQRENYKDHCYKLNKIFNTSNLKNQEYLFMMYSVNETSSLEFSSVYENILREKGFFDLHRISIIRDGKVIDKINESTIKVIDNENSSQDGVVDNSKKINIKVPDVRLGDVVVFEHTVTDFFDEEDFVKSNYVKYVFSKPSSYWTYDTYNFKFINNRKENVVAKELFWRDEDGNIKESSIINIKSGEDFTFSVSDFDSEEKVDSRHIVPFIDFATDNSWKEMSNFFYPYYEEVIKEDIKNIIPDFFENLEKEIDLDHKIRYVIEYVQNNIKYIYSADDMHGHRPQKLSVTLENRQGDCKAKSVLLTALLSYLNVKASPILVNYSADYYLKFYNPSPLSFNHVIVKIYQDDKEYFVDPTSNNQFGLLNYRGNIAFLHYLEIKKDSDLTVNNFTEFKDYGFESLINIEAKNKEEGHIIIEDTYRYFRANSIRNLYKNKSKKEIIDSWANALFGVMAYYQDRNDGDVREIYKNVTLEIISDDKDKNEVKVRFESDIEKPYVFRENKRFLMYFDSILVKSNIIDHTHKDFPIYQTEDGVKLDIVLKSSENIFTKEKYTKQELELDNKYFKYSTKKYIDNKSAKMTIDYKPAYNILVDKDDNNMIKEAYDKVRDSNNGVGIDIKEPGFINAIMRIFDKRTYGKL